MEAWGRDGCETERPSHELSTTQKAMPQTTMSQGLACFKYEIMVAMAEIEPKRWDEMVSIAADDPSTQFHLIITLKQGVSEPPLKAEGFHIEHSMQNIVSGKASLECLIKLRSMKEIELIEEDAEYQLID